MATTFATAPGAGTPYTVPAPVKEVQKSGRVGRELFARDDDDDDDDDDGGDDDDDDDDVDC